MGITQASIDRLNKHKLIKKCDMLELGAQNTYDKRNYGKIAKDFFKSYGINHTSWDITPHQGAIAMDLRQPIEVKKEYDIVTDYGTTEHVSGDYYMAHLNIHNHTKKGGIIIHENPKTGHWIGHGCNYVNKAFYTALAALCNYEIIELTEEYAMGNTVDGCNICVVMRKLSDNEFIDLDTFNSIGNVFAK